MREMTEQAIIDAEIHRIMVGALFKALSVVFGFVGIVLLLWWGLERHSDNLTDRMP